MSAVLTEDRVRWAEEHLARDARAERILAERDARDLAKTEADAREAALAGPALEHAVEEYLALRDSLLDDLSRFMLLAQATAASRQAYELAFSKASKFDALGEHVRVAPSALGDVARELRLTLIRV